MVIKPKFYQSLFSLSRAALILFCMLSNSAYPQSPDPTGHVGEWVKIYTKEEITVFKKRLPGEDLLIFKIVANIAAPIDSILANLRDVEGSNEWLPGVEKKFTVEEYSDLSVVTYSESYVPWPFKNRDFVLTNELTVDKENLFLVLNIKSTSHPKVSQTHGVVRGEIKTGVFCLRPETENLTSAIFFLHIDPKGFIPAWLVNLVQTSWSYEFVKAIEKRANSHRKPLRPGIRQALDRLRVLIDAKGQDRIDPKTTIHE